MSLPADYAERVYAGVLGKIIGVYLGRPFEGWTYDRIMEHLGEVQYYVHEKLGKLLVVTDDDISGTFTFLRAMPDYGNSLDLTAEQIGKTWLNYLIERRTVLWWGGVGQSTEHTAYARLKAGIPAPLSGAIETNGRIVAEQIGSQIFIDGWAMIAPGDPALAADLARRAASVSHDGEAIYGAQVLAAMEAQAFVESDLNKLIDTAVKFIPADSVIYRMIGDIRDWHAEFPDWRTAREQVEAHYGYDQYTGNCHMVPNHGLIILGLLYGDDDFQKSLMITNTAGWDTDCNSGNVGCLLGIKNGLAGIDAGVDWRGPVADRMYLPTADGGRAITDALTETYHVVNIGRAVQGLEPLAPKNGARFHFSLPGSVQGFTAEDSPDTHGVLTLSNAVLPDGSGQRGLVLDYQHLAPGRCGRAHTATFLPPEAIDMPGYMLLASPTLFSGQTVTARVLAAPGNTAPVNCRLFVAIYGDKDALETMDGPDFTLSPGQTHVFSWCIPDTGGAPIARIGFELSAPARADGQLYVDTLAWAGAPDVTFKRPERGYRLWRQAWVDHVQEFGLRRHSAYSIAQNEGTGLLYQGTRDWTDYRVSSAVRSYLVKAGGVAARVQGINRYYALLLGDDQTIRLVKKLDDQITLAEAPFAWASDTPYELALQVENHRLQGWVDGQPVFDVQDDDHPLLAGGVALICTEGSIMTDAVRVQPVETPR
ncbi:MAG: ADP-ribosylglycohydrolase family protein [Anaerolineae bacterium]|nr:ADP-ribosylglycohydrolase family protein [Anaerolineae bacterium]